MLDQNKIPGEWLAIVNPNAGRRRTEKDWPDITRLLVEADIPFLAVFTRHRNHAVRLTEEYLEKGFRKFLVVGGDGTLNEVVNGILQQQSVDPLKVCIGMIPVGTGNDWCRYHEVPFSYEKAVKVLKEGRCMLHDTGLIQMEEGRRYFINMAGMGYDGLVAKKTNEQKDRGRGNAFSYMYNLLSSLLSYRLVDATITLDGAANPVRLFSMSIGVCRYNGGGMMQAPQAVPDDGLLDLTVIRRLSKLAVLRNVPKLFDGSFTRLPMVFTGQGRDILIDTTGLPVEADGESVGQTPCRITVRPAALHVVTGRRE